ncbi:MAG: isopentenyl-diphosphate delta-isomerase [Flavobacteriaceae bacterium]|nr:isopentenyl-diphosphate delta-isomerase [Flavobacteriaceae bacterium]|tara:strand:+ start:11554 stop:12084 length:531 start_codon:yes stop_codon:yes gene_type:complete
MQQENVVLVDSNNNKLGLMPKMEAHIKGVLHRAFSVIIFNNNGDIMLQKRARTKYHTPGLWSNTCCSHQRDNEDNITAGKRRLYEEMGFTTQLQNFDSFIYKVSFSNGLIEHEFDHILTGIYNGIPNLNKKEVDQWKWVSIDSLYHDINNNPDNYTAWFKIIINKYSESLKKWKLQ